MNLTYGVADLHGSDDLLEFALTAIGGDAADAGAGHRSVVFLGDYIDRGPGSRAILDRLMAGPPQGWRWLCLKGNHEQMMLDACDGRADLPWWLDNGGDATLRSFGRSGEGPASVPPAHLGWVRALPALAADRHRVYVHAGVDPAVALDEQDEHGLLWSRERNHLGHQGRFVVHGHTPHPHGPVPDGRSLNLDTLAWSTGRLVVAVFDDARPGDPIRSLEVLRPIQTRAGAMIRGWAHAGSPPERRRRMADETREPGPAPTERSSVRRPEEVAPRQRPKGGQAPGAGAGSLEPARDQSPTEPGVSTESQPT